MAEKSSFFTSLNGDRKYKASDFAEYFRTFIGNGVFPNPSSNLQVISNGDMTLTISPGFAWINGYMYHNTDNLILTVDHSDSALKRVDRVVIKCDFVNREIKTYIKKGTFSQSPVAPALERSVDAYELCVAEIQIDNNVVAIQQSKITDTRLNNEVCGIVTQTVETIDTTTLFNQIEAYKQEFELQNMNWFNATTVKLGDDFNIWFDTVKGILNEDVAGNITNRLLTLEDKVNNLDLIASKVTMADGTSVEETVSANKTSILSLQEELGSNKTTLQSNINAIREVL